MDGEREFGKYMLAVWLDDFIYIYILDNWAVVQDDDVFSIKEQEKRSN